MHLYRRGHQIICHWALASERDARMMIRAYLPIVSFSGPDSGNDIELTGWSGTDLQRGFHGLDWV